jgi:multisubunit Na+/H+ antiporter MnhE subunit
MSIEVSRTALVAFIIVVLYEEARSSWDVAAYRMASVIAGCLIGLVINYVFQKITVKFFPPSATTDIAQSDDKYKPDGGE